MARQQIAGTFGITPDDGTVTAAQNITQTMWHDRLGGMLAISGSGSGPASGELWLIKPSGRLFRLGSRGMNWGGIGWSYDDKLWLKSAGGPNGHYQINAPALDYGGTSYTDASLYSGVSNYARLAARFIQWDGNRVRAWPLPSGAASTELAIVSASAGPGGIIFPYKVSGGDSLWWLATPSTGLLYLYNAVTMTEVTAARSSFGSAFAAASYSRKHDVFAVLYGTTTLTMNLFANEPAAYLLYAPEFDPASPVNGKTAELSAELVGSNGEPCADRLITFAVAVGSVDRATVLTGADGVARTTYRAPFGSSSGNAVTAELVE